MSDEDDSPVPMVGVAAHPADNWATRYILTLQGYTDKKAAVKTLRGMEALAYNSLRVLLHVLEQPDGLILATYDDHINYGHEQKKAMERMNELVRGGLMVAMHSRHVDFNFEV